MASGRGASWGFLVLALAVISLGPRDASERIQSFPTRYIAATTIFLTSISLASHRLRDDSRRPAPTLIAVAMNLLAAPLLCWAAAHLAPPDYRIGLIVAGAMPTTLASAAILTRAAGGNEAIAVLVTLATNALSFVVTSGWLEILTSKDSPLDYGRMAIELLAFALGPVALGQAFRRSTFVSSAADGGRPLIDAVCRVLILFVIIQAGMRTRDQLAQAPAGWRTEDILLVAGICVGVHLALWTLGYWGSRRYLSRPDAIAVAYSGSQKSLPIAAAIIADHYSGVPFAIVPILFYHFGQLSLGAFLAQRLNASFDRDEKELIERSRQAH